MNKPLEAQGAPHSYFDAPGISQSLIKEFIKSPAHARYWLETPKQATKVMDFGSAFHSRVLEPQTFDETVLFQKTFPTKRKPEQEGRIIVAEAQRDTLEAMVDRLTMTELTFGDGKKTNAWDLFQEAETETPIFWEDEPTGLDCKAKPDAIWQGKVFDLKTTGSIKQWLWDYRDTGGIQPSFYLQGLTQATGEFFDQFFYVIIETDAPHGVLFVEVSSEQHERGEQMVRASLSGLAQCLETNSWPIEQVIETDRCLYSTTVRVL